MANALAWITGAGGSCQVFASQTVQDAYGFSGINLSQFIQIVSSIEACKIRAFVDDTPSGIPVACTFSFRTAPDKGGSLIATTQSASTTGGGPQWLTLTFAVNPTLTSDCFLTLESTTGTIKWGYNSAGGYDGTTYCYYFGATPFDGVADLTFEVWSIQ